MICSCGDKKCNGVCSLSVGERLATFLRESDVIRTRIGDIESSKSGADPLIVTGTSVYRDSSQSTLMKKASDVSIPMEGRFNTYADKNARTILSEYVAKSNTEDGKALMNRLRGIEENKLMLMPFKTGQICDVVHTRESKRKDVDGKKIECRSVIECIKWAVMDNADKLQCQMVVSMVDPDTGKKVRLSIVDYCDTFTIVDMERLHTKTKVEGNVIKMSKFGFIKPIQIDDDGTTVIIDNCSVYISTVASPELRVIGSWENNTIKLKERIKNEKIDKAVTSNEDYIGKHRRWIVPYGLYDTNKLKVK